MTPKDNYIKQLEAVDAQMKVVDVQQSIIDATVSKFRMEWLQKCLDIKVMGISLLRKVLQEAILNENDPDSPYYAKNKERIDKVFENTNEQFLKISQTMLDLLSTLPNY